MTLARVALALAVCAAAPVAATVLVPLADDAMVAATDEAVTGVVEHVESVVTAAGAVETWATVRVVDVLKGRVASAHVVVRQPGGVIGDRAVVVLGTTPLAAGDGVLVLGRRAAGGGHRPVGMALGIYQLGIDARGTPVADRATGDRRGLRDLAGSVAGLAGTTPGSATMLARASAAHVVTAPTPVTAPFTFLGFPPASRWFEFDRGRTVEIRLANGDAKLGRARSDTLLRRAMAAWTEVPEATARLAVGPNTTTGPSVASGVCDGRSVAQFNDPAKEIDPMVGCSGVLAVGGFCARTTRIGPGGETFRVIEEGDLTMNRQLGACFSETDVSEVLTHEIGHVLGLGHSSERTLEGDPLLHDATMYFLAHFDGRGASVRADDVAGLRILYPGDSDGDGVPDEFDHCPGTTSGHPADEIGCACSDPDREPCPPGDVCTDSGCDFDSARCVVAPVDCTGGDPCLAGTCTLEAGCATEPVTGYDAVACALERDFAPAVCASDQIPAPYRRLVRRAGRIVAAARTTTPERQERRLDLAARRLARALARLARATDPARRRPVSPACAEALGLLTEDARLRVESRGVAAAIDPTPGS
jgi:hypothetical protein